MGGGFMDAGRAAAGAGAIGAAIAQGLRGGKAP
jgi:hypothetical protein